VYLSCMERYWQGIAALGRYVNTHTHTHTYIYIYVGLCVVGCGGGSGSVVYGEVLAGNYSVCVCVRAVCVRMIGEDYGEGSEQ